LKKKYGKKISYAFQNFPLGFHKNALPAARVIECLGDEKGLDAYYQLIDVSFTQGKSDIDFMKSRAVAL
jgi:hypothetical protein